MTKTLLQITGWLLARAPEILLHLFSWTLGPVILLIPRRRRILHSNLHHAFPGRPRAWRARIARQSCRRLIETSLLSLASPYLSDARLRQIGHFSPSVIAAINRRAAEGAQHLPAVVTTLHMAYWESLTWLGLFTDYRCEIGVVFRPLGNKNLNDWIKKTRERHGMKLFSRRDGLMEVFRVMRRRGIVSILFDQNAGGPGALTTLLGRVCSTSEFPGTLVEKYGARLSVMYARRLGFWRIRYEFADIAASAGIPAADATIALNRWLENALATDEDLCASWLWSHARWKSQNAPDSRFRFKTNHGSQNMFDADLAAHGWTRDTMPRRTRVWLRMPGDPAHHAHLFPLLRALRRSRPDTELTLFADAGASADAGADASVNASTDASANASVGAAASVSAAAGALAALEPLRADRTVDFLRALPSSRWLGSLAFGTLLHFWKLRREYPDVFVNLSETRRSDREMSLTRAPQRFGIIRPGTRRPKLTNAYEAPTQTGAVANSPAEDYKNFFAHFGLPEEFPR